MKKPATGQAWAGSGCGCVGQRRGACPVRTAVQKIAQILPPTGLICCRLINRSRQLMAAHGSPRATNHAQRLLHDSAAVKATLNNPQFRPVSDEPSAELAHHEIGESKRHQSEPDWTQFCLAHALCAHFGRTYAMRRWRARKMLAKPSATKQRVAFFCRPR